MVVDGGRYRVEFNDRNGSIVSLRDQARGHEFTGEPRLPDSFRLLLPLPELEANYLLGREQALSSSELGDSTVTLRWDGPLVSAQGVFDLAVTMRVTLSDVAVTFDLEVVNGTQFPLAEVWYPLLGGMMPPGEPVDTKLLLPTGGWGTVCQPLFRFPETMVPGGGVSGSRFPEYLIGYPGALSMPWVDWYDERLGWGPYVASHDTVARHRVFRLEMHPGLKHNVAGSNWPRLELRDDQFASPLVMGWVHFPYTPPGETFRGSQVVLRTHDGDWHHAARIFRAWHTSQFPGSRHDWLAKQLALQDTMFLLPEGNVQMTYADIPRWARDARDYGVRAVLISRWDVGGHDSHYPQYEPDPRLGTWDELADAVGQCHELGLRVLFFANFSPVDCATDWFREELRRYQSTNRWGVADRLAFGMGTLGARLGFSARPRPALTACTWTS